MSEMTNTAFSDRRTDGRAGLAASVVGGILEYVEGLGRVGDHSAGDEEAIGAGEVGHRSGPPKAQSPVLHSDPGRPCRSCFRSLS